MQSFSLQFSPIPLSFLPPPSLYFMTISLRRFGWLPHTVKQDQCVQKANSVSVEFFCSFLCEGFFPVLFWVSFAIHCLCFLRLVYSAALTLGLAHLAPWIQSSDVPADARNTKAIEYLEQ